MTDFASILNAYKRHEAEQRGDLGMLLPDYVQEAIRLTSEEVGVPRDQIKDVVFEASRAGEFAMRIEF